ncbi:MAG: iron complex outermembrane receptor protein, partial [Alteromonadaceae bacterium]
MLPRLPISAFTIACFSMESCSVLAATELTEKSKSNNSDAVSEVIVVTGTLQQSGLLSLAGNIDRLSSDDIASVSSVHPSDILNRATGVHVQTNNGMESLPSLRSPVLTGPGAAGAFLFLEEGISTRSAG